jgi:hypothetical protein
MELARAWTCYLGVRNLTQPKSSDTVNGTFVASIALQDSVGLLYKCLREHAALTSFLRCKNVLLAKDQITRFRIPNSVC